MALNIKFLKLSKVVVSSAKSSHFGHNRSLLFDNCLPLKRTCFRSIVASPKESFNPGNDDLSQTFLTFKYLRLVKNAVREAGPIVEENKKLATLLSRARENKLSTDFMNFAQKIAIDSRSHVGLLEVLLENHCHLIIQYEDIDLTITKPHLLKICDRCDGHLMRKDAKWPVHFEQRGMLFVKGDTAESSVSDLKGAKLIVSEVGAISVEHKIDVEKCPYLVFYCDPGELHEVKDRLTNKGCKIEEAYVGYLPKHKIALTNSARKAMFRAITELSKVPTIDNVFTNIM